MTNLSHETVFITGATSGFGYACAVFLHALGAKVILTGRREERLQALQQTLGSRAFSLAFDVRSHEEVKDAIASLPLDFSSVTVLVNNAGLALGLEPAQICDLNDWEIMVDTNIKGLMYCTHALLPTLLQQKRGYIFNIGSTAGKYAYPGGNVYGGTKAFVHQFSYNLRTDLIGKNIRVTCIAPGLAETEFSEVRFHGDKKRADAVYEQTQPLTAEDIAQTIGWCLQLPPHVNINFIEMMTLHQVPAGLTVYKTPQ